MEKILGRYLTLDEVVHHLNGIRDDNRPENLTLVTAQSHDTLSLIHAMQSRIRELEAGQSRNGSCGRLSSASFDKEVTDE
jgi:hypothetical protein